MNIDLANKPSCFAKFYFCISGISILMTTNAIITANDFFELEYPRYEVSFTLRLPLFFTSMITTFLMVKI